MTEFYRHTARTAFPHFLRTAAWGVLGSIFLFGASLLADARGWSDLRDPFLYPATALFRGGSLEAGTIGNLTTILEEQLPPSSREQAREIAVHLHRLCREYRLDPAFVLSVIDIESSFRTDVVSSAGAIGLMQLMPATAAHLARKYDLPYAGARSLRDPKINLRLGMVYLAELRGRYRGLSPYYVLAAFNMGPARLDILRAKPTFKPEKTLKYYEDVMRGVDRWRSYGAEKFTLGAETKTVRGLRSPSARKAALKDRTAPVGDVWGFRSRA